MPMPEMISVEVHSGIKSPVLQKLHKQLTQSIISKVLKVVAEETSLALEAIETAIDEANKETRGGAK